MFLRRLLDVFNFTFGHSENVLRMSAQHVLRTFHFVNRTFLGHLKNLTRTYKGHMDLLGTSFERTVRPGTDVLGTYIRCLFAIWGIGTHLNSHGCYPRVLKFLKLTNVVALKLYLVNSYILIDWISSFSCNYCGIIYIYILYILYRVIHLTQSAHARTDELIK